METNQAVLTLAALAQAARLEVFRLLVQAGPAGMCAGDIAAATGIAPSSLSFHLKELRHAQLVQQQASGRFLIYSANFSVAAALLAFLSANCCAGQACALPNSASVQE